MKIRQILTHKLEVLLDKGEQVLSCQATDSHPVDEEMTLNETWRSEGMTVGLHSKKAAD